MFSHSNRYYTRRFTDIPQLLVKMKLRRWIKKIVSDNSPKYLNSWLK